MNGYAPRVVIIIPCYNDGPYLREALSSLVAQEEHELVVVDDGSDEPETLRILSELELAGIHILRQANGGLSAARMAGVAATTAPLVLALDADDMLPPGAIKALADALDKDAQAALAWGDIETFGDVSERRSIARELDPWRLTFINDLPVNALVRRSVLEEVGGWELQGGYEDWDLWMKLAELGHRGVYVPRTTLFYRKHGVRMVEETRIRHAERLALLRNRHPLLFANRRRNWLRSSSPLAARLALPLIGLIAPSPLAETSWSERVMDVIREGNIFRRTWLQLSNRSW